MKDGITKMYVKDTAHKSNKIEKMPLDVDLGNHW